jgi:hypothetical protein
MSPLQFLLLAVLKFQLKFSNLRRANIGKFKFKPATSRSGHSRASARRARTATRRSAYAAAPQRPDPPASRSRARGGHHRARVPPEPKSRDMLTCAWPPRRCLGWTPPPLPSAPRLSGRPLFPFLPCFEEKPSKTSHGLARL